MGIVTMRMFCANCNHEIVLIASLQPARYTHVDRSQAKQWECTVNV